MRNETLRRIGWTTVLALGAWSAATAWAQEVPSPAPIQFRGASPAVKSDVSPPLRTLLPLESPPGCKAENENQDTGIEYTSGPQDQDPLVQAMNASPQALPAPLANFDGFASLCSCAPPDPVGDVGPNHYVAMANLHFAIYSKTGTLLYGPAANNTLWSGFGGACETENAGDPIVLYDQAADRWIMTQFTAAGPTYNNCVAVSTSGDPLGSWYRYAFSTGSNFPDYPKYGVWSDGYYLATREFAGMSSFVGVGVYALDRAAMLSGLPATTISFLVPPVATGYNIGDGLLPADLDGSTPPPAGSPEFFLGSMDDGGGFGAPQDALNLYKFHVDWTTPANSTFSLASTLPIAAVDTVFPCTPSAQECIPQLGTTRKVDFENRQRPLHRLAYRNFGTHQSLVTNQSVEATTGIAGIRWWEVRDPNGTPVVYQEGTYAPGAVDGVHRWMGSIAMDRVGDMALGYSASNASMYPSIWYTGRLVSDALGQMAQGEGQFVNGAGSQTGLNRWGDYTSMNVDPVDDCTFWYINEYYTASSSATWNLRIASFRFPSCLCSTIPAAPVATGATAPANNRITVTWNDASAPSITRYFVFRGTASGGPFTQIATVADTSPGAGGTGTYSYNDSPVSGGTRYYYVVRADDGAACTSANSNEVNALATGPCLFTPTFAGLASATNAEAGVCAVNLAWSAGTAKCGGPLFYEVHRSTTYPFTPGPSTLIAATASTTYADGYDLANGTTYYYVVRAVDKASGTEDSNAVTLSAVPTGAVTVTTYVSEGFEVAPPSGWSHSAAQGTDDWAQSAVQKHGGTYSFFSSDVASLKDDLLVTPAFTLSSSGQMTFWHLYAMENTFDGCVIEITTDGGLTWADLGSAVTAGGYTGTISASFSSPIAGRPAWTGTIGAFTQVTVNLAAYAGMTCQIRFRLACDTSVASTGWYVDDVLVFNRAVATCGTVNGPPGVPNGVSGTAMMASKSGTSIALTWDVGCGATNYDLVYGGSAQLPTSYSGVYNLSGGQCLIGTSGSRTWAAPAIPPGSTFLWWLVVANDGASTQGSWGRNSGDQERTGPDGGGAGSCGRTLKSLSNTCGQ